MRQSSLLFLLLLIFGHTAISQTKAAEKPFNMSLYYGTSNCLGFDFLYCKKVILGAGCSFNLAGYAKGKDYTNTINPNSYPSEIYEIKEVKDLAIYGNIGVMLSSSFGVYAQIGYGGRQKVYNSFDNSYILASDGYYYFTEKLDGTFNYGLSAIYIFRKSHINALAGYDNFSGVKIGAGLFF